MKTYEYPSGLLQAKADEIRRDDAGVIWLGKDSTLPEEIYA